MWNVSTIWVITNDATCIREIKFRTSIAKATFNKKKTFSPANLT
jgi:hypothetical protein